MLIRDKEHRMAVKSAVKKPTNLSLDKALLAEAKSLDINLSSAAETGIRKAVSETKAERWKGENAEAIEGWNRWVEEHGLPLDKYRMF
jgi:antitoxin CcdA